tara:strand:+ start:666 stop:2159 length:1494 start_codon:yes stop_codon:yes gene_type:complete
MKEIKVVLLYPPHQSWTDTMCKPNGSLAYPNLAGALQEIGVDVEVYDACVGNDKDDLDEVFYRSSELENGLIRTGVSDERILQEVAEADIVGLTSIFSDQETMVLQCVKLIKSVFPDKFIIAGGVNARSRRSKFYQNGVDLICLSESEITIQQIAFVLQKGQRNFSEIPGVAFQIDGSECVNKITAEEVVWDLDKLPMPAWDMLPNERYWKIGRPHGGHFEQKKELRYASMMTSTGCVFACRYCHIAGETDNNGDSGPIGRFRAKSDERVLAELESLKSLGVKQIFLEDDSLFGRKKRMIRLMRKIQGLGFEIFAVNGVNIPHVLKNYSVDMDVVEALSEAGVKELSLPFESGNQRILRKYANNKWDLEKSDIEILIRTYRDHGITICGNYMIGFPDETRKEIEQTIEMARRHVGYGLNAANFLLVLPLPGTPLYDEAVEGNYLDKDFDIDRMHWQKANMKNTAVTAHELEEIRHNAWCELNDASWVKYKTNMKATL